MKKYKITGLVIAFLLFCTTNFAQKVDSLLVQGHADCMNRLTIETRKTIGPTTAPKGHGQILEFAKNSKKNLHFMERENHTVWYQFSIKTKGQLSFELEPLDSLDDYDFALYKYTDEHFCEDVKEKKILPIRTNFSRNKPDIGSKTGLKTGASKEYIGAGVQPAYSKTIEVSPEEQYVLLVNNVYKEGSGHYLHFNYWVNLDLKGTVSDKLGAKGLGASITLTNTKTGDVVARTQSDSTTGAYRLVFDLPKSQLKDPLHLEIMKDNYFFFDTLVTAYKIATKMRNIPLKTSIQKLKKGDRFVVSNILFYGDSPKPLPNSLPSIKALYKTMKRNKKLKISIEGHTNGCNRGEAFALKLSNERAATVYNYLIENKIAKERLSSIGYGCKHVLHNTNGRYAHLNRRVEIEIVDF